MFICDGLLCASRQLHCLLIDRTVCLTHLYKKHVLWTRTPYGYRGSAAAVTSLLCVDAFSLKTHQGQPKRRRYGVSSSESLLVSLSKMTFTLTRAIEIRAPDKDPLMVLWAEIGSEARLRWALRWTGSFFLTVLSGIDSSISLLWPWVDSSIRAVSVGQLGFCYN